MNHLTGLPSIYYTVFKNVNYVKIFNHKIYTKIKECCLNNIIIKRYNYVYQP